MINNIIDGLTRPSHLLRSTLNWLTPHKCISCKNAIASQDAPCCRDCHSKLPFHPHCCHRCGQVFAVEADFCGRCLAKPPAFDACFCPFQYQDPIAGQIRDFKYNNRPELAHSLGKLLTKEIKENAIQRPELIIPVPLHLSRLRERGYNQSSLLAKVVGKQLNIPVDTRVIKKTKATAAQAQLTLKQRANNLKGSFKQTKTVSIQSVAILDDVVTTGATAAEIAKILKRNGVDYVQIWGLAHTI